MRVTIPRSFRQFLYAFTLTLFAAACPAVGLAESVFDFTLYVPGQFNFVGSYSVNTDSLAAALAGSTAATVAIDSFDVSNNGSLIYSGPGLAGSELFFPTGYAGSFNWAIYDNSFGLYFDGVSSPKGSLKDCLTSTCSVTGTWNGSGTATYTQNPSPDNPELVPEPSPFVLLGTGGLAALAGLRRRVLRGQYRQRS